MTAFMTLGGSEILVILFIVLLLFGAKRLPDLARSLGQAKQEFIRGARDLPSTAESGAREVHHSPNTASASNPPEKNNRS